VSASLGFKVHGALFKVPGGAIDFDRASSRSDRRSELGRPARTSNRAPCALHLKVALTIMASLSSGCATQPRAQATGADARDPAVTSVAPMPHGDHRPHFGGLVLMNGDLHFEVVAKPDGHYRVYFSDEVRKDLPASIASEVVLTISRPHEAPEPLILSVDDEGESWVGEGRPFGSGDVAIRVAFVFEDKPYFIDIPWSQPAPTGSMMTSL
jgi:hypothetical protein